jgi:hypothetical protein
MLRYKLRTLMIVLALGPPVLACAWWFGSRLASPPGESIVRFHAGGDIRIVGKIDR